MQPLSETLGYATGLRQYPTKKHKNDPNLGVAYRGIQFALPLTTRFIQRHRDGRPQYVGRGQIVPALVDGGVLCAGALYIGDGFAQGAREGLIRAGIFAALRVAGNVFMYAPCDNAIKPVTKG